MVLLSCLIGFGMMFLAYQWAPADYLWLTGFLLPSFVVFIYGCIHLAQKRWRIGLWYMTVPPLMLLVGFCLISQPLLLVYYAGKFDTFAVGLHIPTDITLTDTRDTGYDNKVTSDYEITQDGQPGRYRADIQIHLPTTGNVYLRAYEITKGTSLSSSSLKQTTLRHFGASAQQGHPEMYRSEFAIYEGDWGQPYAARFEVWLIPADKSPEVKLKEKNFIIEGWMR